MLSAKGYAAHDAGSPLKPFSFKRRDPGINDVLIEIAYCGVCHSDIHQVRDEWNKGIYPIVPGHEIVGKVTQVGNNVKNFKVGDLAAVGCLVDSCRTCGSCKDGLEQYCEGGFVPTYNGYEKDGKTITYGGYSNCIVVDEAYTLKVPKNLDLAATAPLLCAGITMYSPLRNWGVKPGTQVAVMGLGGLGHMAVKLARAMGADVALFSRSEHKVEDAKRLGVTDVLITRDIHIFEKYAEKFDLILNTISAEIDLNQYLTTLKRDGTLVMLGVSPQPINLSPISVIFRRKCVAGSLIGGIAETQEMLDFCGENDITSDIEIIRMDQINEAYERVIQSDVKYRFVIDMQTL